MRWWHIQQKGFARAFASLVAVCALLSASVGVPVASHWCHGVAVDVQLYAQAADCGMADGADQAGESFAQRSCCDSRNLLLSAAGLDHDGGRCSVIQNNFSVISDFARRFYSPVLAGEGRVLALYNAGPPLAQMTPRYEVFESYLI